LPKLSKDVTTNVQLAKRVPIPYFGDFYAYYLINKGNVSNQSSIINLNNADGSDIHWMAYAKQGDRAINFDSFGNLRAPKELVRYLDVT